MNPDKTSSDAQANNRDLPFDRIDRYQIVQFLGQGGMGRVYQAKHLVTHRPCALKMLPKDLAQQRSFITRFQAEAQVLAKLDHPNIVRVYNGGEAEGEFFLDMEYVDGGDLQDYVDKSSSNGIPSARTKEVTEGLLKAVSYAHSLNIIHRDLKPSNILLRSDGTVKVSDFGLAAVVGEDYHKSLIQKSITLSQVGNMETLQGSTDSATAGFAGTILFMSPQALRGARPDMRDDIYAVGVIAYFMLTGRTPSVNSKPVSKSRQGVEKRWDQFISKCLAEDLSERFQNADEALKMLNLIGRKSKTTPVVISLVAALGLCAGVAFAKPDLLPPELQAKLGLSKQEPAPKPREPKPEPVIVAEKPKVAVAENIPPKIAEPEKTPDNVGKSPVLPSQVIPEPAPVIEKPAPPPIPTTLTFTLANGSELIMKRISPGTFRMGSPPEELGRLTDELAKTVEIKEPFYIGTTEITQAHYEAIIKQNPSHNRFKGGQMPVEQVVFENLIGPDGFIAKLNIWLRDQGFTRYKAALPTEAEWEYAARAGTTTAFNDGAEISQTRRDPALDRLAIYRTTESGQVGTLAPNAWGLFDMHGNVAEWTAEGVLRGGSFNGEASACRMASRLRGYGASRQPDKRFGFRIIMREVK